VRFIASAKPASPLAGGSHPTALLLDRSNTRLFVALTNRDEIAVLDTTSGKRSSTFRQNFPAKNTAAAIPNTSPSLLTRKRSSPPMRFLTR